MRARPWYEASFRAALLAAALGALPACEGSAWTDAASMIDARANHTSTPLDDGRLLLAGGKGASGYLTSAELFNPLRAELSAAAPLLEARARHTATALETEDGIVDLVLVAGGEGSGAGALGSAELFDPAANQWMKTAPMLRARRGHTATWLPKSGQVLVAGGEEGAGAIDMAELFVPTTAQQAIFVPIASLMMAARAEHSATYVGDANGDRVLIAGGSAGQGAISTAEMYDPAASASFSNVAPMRVARRGHTATLLSNGRVLVVGGDDGQSPLSSAEVYDPKADAWLPAGELAEARRGHTATLLNGGDVLVVGGVGASGALSTAELYNPEFNEWSSADKLTEARSGHTASLLVDGSVLVAGGEQEAALQSVERYKGAESAALPCETIEDCPTSFVCNEDHQCEQLPASLGSTSCSASAGGPRAGGGELFFGAVSVIVACLRRRQAPRARRLSPRKESK